MKLSTFGLRRWMPCACAAAGLSMAAGWGVAWAAPESTFDHTVRLPTPIYLGWGDAVPVPADYSGDGRADLAVYMESSGMWYARTMGMARVWELPLGGPGWRACPADYDGDGKADPAVYANGVWAVALSSRGYALQTMELGAGGFEPVPADYDGDGKADPAVYGNGVWTAALSTCGYAEQTMEFGAVGLAPAPADYDGDGKADPAVYSRTLGHWAAALSASGYVLQTLSFNLPGTVPMPGDYDGDGKTDLAIYHEASGLWLGCMSGSGYELSYQLLGGGGYVPVAGRFYHTKRHTFGVYNPSAGEWQVWYPPADMGEEESSGGLFGGFLQWLVEGAAGDARCWGVGWVLDLLTHQDKSDPQVLQQLNSMDAKMTTLLQMTSALQTQLNNLAVQLELDTKEMEAYIVGQTAQNAINTITTHYDQYGFDSMATFFSSTFTNTYPDTNEQHTLVNNFALNVENNYPIKDSVTAIHNAIIPNGFGEVGLLESWTTNFILSAATADSLYDYYLTLESYYAYLYSYLMKGASTYVDAENYLYSNDFGYVTGTLTPMINAEVDQFEQCTYQMLLSKADFVNNYANTPTFVPLAAATNILPRNMFMAAQARGTNAYGLNAFILATMDAVTNGMPQIFAKHSGAYYYPVTSRWISVTGPAYDCWGNGRMHATNAYAFLQYSFGANLPVDQNNWTIWPMGVGAMYPGYTTLQLYDDSLAISPTGNAYGVCQAQLRNGGPSFFANSNAPYFGATTYTHQVVGDPGYPSAIMGAAVQYPAGTNVVVVSVLITNGALIHNFSDKQGDITVNAHALWTFIYDGQAPANGTLRYRAATSGSYKLSFGGGHTVGGTTETDSFVAQIDVFDQTTNGICASGVVKSFVVHKQKYPAGNKSSTTIDFGANTNGALAVQFQPGHVYQVRAGWDCSGHSAPNVGDAYAAPWNYHFALDVDLAVQGLAVTFD